MGRDVCNRRQFQAILQGFAQAFPIKRSCLIMQWRRLRAAQKAHSGATEVGVKKQSTHAAGIRWGPYWRRDRRDRGQKLCQLSH